jgi:hypothetical protein
MEQKISNKYNKLKAGSIIICRITDCLDESELYKNTQMVGKDLNDVLQG